MGRLGERLGLREPRTVLQVDSLDEPTRNRLWNITESTRVSVASEYLTGREKEDDLLRALWIQHYEARIDELDSYNAQVVRRMKDDIVTGDWLAALELVESFADLLGTQVSKDLERQTRRMFNAAFEMYLVGFRFVEGVLVPVSDSAEVGSITDALATTAGSTTRTHLDRALSLLSNKSDPQYAKVVGECVNAVESEVRLLTGANVLSDGLKKLEASGSPIHPALQGAWTKLYGYSSDAGGIRHALIKDEEVDEPLAVYFLVSCSAFINLLRKVRASARS